MNKKVVIVLGIIGIVIIAVGCFMYMEVQTFNHPWGQSPQDDFLLDIEEGQSATVIAENLVEKEVIKNTNMFLIMADLRGFADKLKAGEYMIHGASTPMEILNMFAIGWNYRHNLVIPEGFTQSQIADRCAEQEICTREEFLAECQLRNNMFGFVIAQAPNGANAAIEGVLFPDTYQFIKNTPAERVVNRMLTRFNTVWGELSVEATSDPDQRWWWMDEALVTQKQMHDVVVLASIIEKEAKKDEDRPLIASVFVNRIKKGMPLQSDATVRYFTDNWDKPLTKSQLEEDSPYNTRKNPGLPVAPICNPGRASLAAAMMPPESEYLYFITMPDGETKFSKTHDEHVQWRREIRQAE